MEKNHGIQPSNSLGVPKGAGSSDVDNNCIDDVVLPVRAAYDRTALHIGVGNNRGVYLETPVLLEGEKLKTAVEQATKAYWDKQCRTNNSSKHKKKNKRFRVVTKKKNNKLAKKIKARTQLKCNKDIACFRNTTGSNVRLEIQINECAAPPTPSNSGVSQYSLTTDENVKGDPDVTTEKTSPDQTGPPGFLVCAANTDKDLSETHERELYNKNASNISAVVSMLDEVVAKFNELTLSDKKEINVADEVSRVNEVSAMPTNKVLHKHITAKKLLADIKTIRENVANSLATDSLSHSPSVVQADVAQTSEVEPVCTGSGSVVHTNETASARVLSDIKVLKEMLSKSLELMPTVPDQSISENSEREVTRNVPAEEEPRDHAAPQDTAVDEHAGEDVDNITDEMYTSLFNWDDNDYFGILNIYKNSCLHDGIGKNTSNESREGTDYGYQYFCLSNLLC